ncbi:MAG: holin family protein [Deltaproteobacteria bacterium]|nr:holin family protein [Deltaproteobacteria bacterium]
MGFDITGLGSVADAAKSIIERIFPPKMTDAEKAQAQVQLQELLQQRENNLIEAQRSIIVSEMSQGDSFTKRARPTIVYAGLAFIFLVHVAFPIIAYINGQDLPQLSLPDQFWWAWTGVCGVWIIGRSAEKKGIENKVVSMITGK